MTLKTKERFWSNDYIEFWFNYKVIDGPIRPYCILSQNLLVNDSARPTRLSEHLKAVHPSLAKKWTDLFSNRSLKSLITKKQSKLS